MGVKNFMLKTKNPTFIINVVSLLEYTMTSGTAARKAHIPIVEI